MDFELPEELKMIQSLARDFVEGQLKPLEREILGKAADLSDAHAWLSPERETYLIKQVKELGLWGIGVPEDLGGAGLSTLGVCLVEEELANTIIPFSLGDVTPILFDCNAEQREKYFKPAFNHEKRPLLALMENPACSTLSLGAEKVDGHYTLKGQKLSLSRAGVDYFGVVFGKTGNGLTCFLVDKETPGFAVTGIAERNGWLSRVREPLVLNFENCLVLKDNVLGEDGKAFNLGAKWLPQRRIVRAARAVGIARRLLVEASIQAQTASSFGQNISRRASIRAALADMSTEIHAARLMVYEAACAADTGKNVARQAVTVKLFTSNMLRSVTDMVAHIYNGPSSAGLIVEKLCRHVLENNIKEMALEKQRNIIAGDILKGLAV